MVAAVGCPADTFLYASTANSGDVIEAGRRLGLQTILAVMQILDQTLSRMKYSTQARILAELALVRICNLEDLEELSSLIVQLQTGQPWQSGTPAGSSEQGAGIAARSQPLQRHGRCSASPHLPAAKKKYEPAAESPHGNRCSLLPAPCSPLPAPCSRCRRRR